MRATNDSIFRPALLLAAGRGVALATTFSIPILFARVLDPQQFGAYKQIFLIHATVYGIGLGLADALFYFVPAEPERAGRYVGNSLALLGGIGIGGWLLPTAARSDIAPAFPKKMRQTWATLAASKYKTRSSKHKTLYTTPQQPANPAKWPPDPYDKPFVSLILTPRVCPRSKCRTGMASFRQRRCGRQIPRNPVGSEPRAAGWIGLTR